MGHQPPAIRCLERTDEIESRPMHGPVAIVGGSIAGAALAIHLGRRGIRTVVYEKTRFPRRKACGEGLLPHGYTALRSLVNDAPPGVEVSGIRYWSPKGGHATAAFGDLGPGLMVRREVFDAWLLDQARRTPNVRVLEEEFLESDATVVVGADGMRSMFHGRPPFKRTHPKRERVGMSTRIEGYAGGDRVDVFIGVGGEAYVGPAGNGESSLALLMEKGGKPENVLAGIPALAGVRFTLPWIGASPLGSRVTPLVHGRTLLLGDAAGAADPITGEGMSLAILSAGVAAEAIAAGDLAVYETERRRLARPSERLAKLILRLAGSPWLAERTVQLLRNAPAVFARLLREACSAR